MLKKVCGYFLVWGSSSVSDWFAIYSVYDVPFLRRQALG